MTSDGNKIQNLKKNVACLCSHHKSRHTTGEREEDTSYLRMRINLSSKAKLPISDRGYNGSPQSNLSIPIGCVEHGEKHKRGTFSTFPKHRGKRHTKRKLFEIRMCGSNEAFFFFFLS